MDIEVPVISPAPILNSMTPKSFFENLKTYLEPLGINADINLGTANTPGEHLRITVDPDWKTVALSNVLKKFNIQFIKLTKNGLPLIGIYPVETNLSMNLELLQNLKSMYESEVNALEDADKFEEVVSPKVSEISPVVPTPVPAAKPTEIQEPTPVEEAAPLKNETAAENFLNTLKQLIEPLDIPAEIEINLGTISTPGKHLRVTGYPSYELTALANILEQLSIKFEWKSKGQMRMLVIDTCESNVSLNFQLLKNFKAMHEIELAALKKIYEDSIKIKESAFEGLRETDNKKSFSSPSIPNDPPEVVGPKLPEISPAVPTPEPTAKPTRIAINDNVKNELLENESRKKIEREHVFNQNKAKIQMQFITELAPLFRTFQPHLQIYNDLNVAQKDFFLKLQPDLSPKQLDQLILDFRNLCKDNVAATDKIMGPGWLSRIVEVLFKAVAGLFVGIGMVLGTVAGQGLAKAEHRQRFKDTFFTLNSSDKSKALNQFKDKILGENEENEGLISSQNLKKDR